MKKVALWRGSRAQYSTVALTRAVLVSHPLLCAIFFHIALTAVL